MKKQKIPFRADLALIRLIKTAKRRTGLTGSEVMRQGLIIGVPELVNRLCAVPPPVSTTNTLANRECRVQL